MNSDRLSDEALIRASSPKIFERGKTYASSGAVSVIGEEAGPQPSIRAEVAGTQLYLTSVRIDDGEPVGSCDCPNADDGWFCKHQVAVALVWRHRLAGTELVVDEAASKKVRASAKRAQTLRERHEALQEFLRRQPATALADKLTDLGETYREIERELHQWQRLASAEPEDLRSLVSEILAVGQQFVPLPEVSAYVRRAAAVLPLLKGARERDGASAAALSLHALRRSWVALARADDSNGEIGDLSRAIAAEWIAALQCAGAQLSAFGDAYLRLQLEDPFGCFDEIAAEEAMGTSALNRYQTTLAAQWRQAKDAVVARTAERAATFAASKRRASNWLQRDESEMRLTILERLYLAQLARTGDHDTELAVLREDLSEPHKCSRVTAFLERHGRAREALASAESGCKAFPDDWRLQEDLLRCYERDGWTDEAYALLRRQFEEAPTVERFHRTLTAGVAAKKDGGALRQELLREIEKRELEAARRGRPLPPAIRGVPSGAQPRDVSLRAQILCSERLWDQACALVQPPAVCQPGVLRQIALHLGETRREESLALLLRVFGQAMRTASTPYRDELALVGEIAERLDAVGRGAWLAKLRVDFKAKRNFVRDLPSS